MEGLFIVAITELEIVEFRRYYEKLDKGLLVSEVS